MNTLSAILALSCGDSAALLTFAAIAFFAYCIIDGIGEAWRRLK
jgi:hypothetical protein